MFMIMAGMDPCILLWVILLIAFVVGELITVGLTSIWFAAGSLVALLAAVLGANPVVQIILFLVVAVGLLARQDRGQKNTSIPEHKEQTRIVLSERLFVLQSA